LCAKLRAAARVEIAALNRRFLPAQGNLEQIAATGDRDHGQQQRHQHRSTDVQASQPQAALNLGAGSGGPQQQACQQHPGPVMGSPERPGQRVV